MAAVVFTVDSDSGTAIALATEGSRSRPHPDVLIPVRQHRPAHVPARRPASLAATSTTPVRGFNFPPNTQSCLPTTPVHTPSGDRRAARSALFIRVRPSRRRHAGSRVHLKYSTRWRSTTSRPTPDMRNHLGPPVVPVAGRGARAIPRIPDVTSTSRLVAQVTSRSSSSLHEHAAPSTRCGRSDFPLITPDRCSPTSTSAIRD